MAKVQGQDFTPENEGEGLESGTPKDAQQVAGSLYSSEKKNGLRLAAPRREVVDTYPERPFSDAQAK